MAYCECIDDFDSVLCSTPFSFCKENWIVDMKYNIYCDESCHLEHDREKIMVIGGIKIKANSRRRINNDIKEIKNKHRISEYAEIKWNKVSSCNYKYFMDLIDYFFECDDMLTRPNLIMRSMDKHMMNFIIKCTFTVYLD